MLLWLLREDLLTCYRIHLTLRLRGYYRYYHYYFFVIVVLSSFQNYPHRFLYNPSCTVIRCKYLTFLQKIIFIHFLTFHHPSISVANQFTLTRSGSSFWCWMRRTGWWMAGLTASLAPSGLPCRRKDKHSYSLPPSLTGYSAWGN